jgi:hypothetical protein
LTELTRLTKVLWVAALALLALTFAVASSEGLKWALGGRSLFSSSSAPINPACPPPNQLRPGVLVAQLGRQAAYAYLTRCRSELPGNVFPAPTASSPQPIQAEVLRGLTRR